MRMRSLANEDTDKPQSSPSPSSLLPNYHYSRQLRIPIHYIPDPLFGLHIFNTTLLVSHLEEFHQQSELQQQQQQQQ